MAPSCNETFVTADEKEIEVVGMAHITVDQTSMRCLVSPSISREIFFGWQDLIHLGVISPDFPNIPREAEQVSAVSQHSPDLQASAEKLLKDFDYVFSDTLSPTNHITCLLYTSPSPRDRG